MSNSLAVSTEAGSEEINVFVAYHALKQTFQVIILHEQNRWGILAKTSAVPRVTEQRTNEFVGSRSGTAFAPLTASLGRRQFEALLCHLPFVMCSSPHFCAVKRTKHGLHGIRDVCDKRHAADF